MNQERESGGGGWGGFARWTGIGLVILVAVYVLSFGPVLRLCIAGKLPPVPFAIIYDPLIDVTAGSGQLRRLVELYVRDVWRCRVIIEWPGIDRGMRAGVIHGTRAPN
jgi:hypothetical protein